jgi:quercetin dioxygenase-like cupin family protein
MPKKSTIPSTVPPDDPRRKLAIARPDGDSKLPFIGIVGDTYMILLTGNDTRGRFCLIDMHIPPGGGPPPHRHDFEESFTMLDGEIEVTFRGARSVLRAGETANIPANAPHQFQNRTGQSARLLCICSPAGQEEFFLALGVPVAGRTTPPPKPDTAAMAAFKAKSEALAPKYRTQILSEA